MAATKTTGTKAPAKKAPAAKKPAARATAAKKPAQRAKKGVPNPFKPGETMDVAAKPASVRVRITPLKKLKDMAQ
jgi:hypothetical protein